MTTTTTSKTDLDERLNHVDYNYFNSGEYIPSSFALKFIAFIKLVNGSEGEENKSPIIHYDMLDQIVKCSNDSKGSAKRFIQNLFVSFRGSAKALALDTPIMTPTGNVPIGDLVAGDTVFDRNGKKTVVNRVSEVFNNDTYEFKLSDGTSFIANEDHYHIVHVRTIKKVGGVNVNYFKEEELTTLELLERGIHYNRTVTTKCPYGKEVKWFIPLVSNEVDYDYTPTPIDPYTVGYVLGDGNVSAGSGMVTLTAEAKDFTECLSYIPYKHGTVYVDKRNTNILSTRVHVLSKLVLTHLGDKTCLDKFIPNVYLHNSIEVRLEVLRGLMDTDGTVTGKGRCSFTSVSESLANGVLHLVKSLGANATINRYENNYSGYYTVAFSLQNHNPFKLKRKANRWKSNTKYKAGPRVSILSVEKTNEPVPSRCISVASPTRSFLIENSVVTRNTTALHEYMFLYIAVYGEVEGFGRVDVAMYISDTIDNGVKSMRTNLEYRWNNSAFLQKYVPKVLMTSTDRAEGTGKVETKFTDVRWEFVNLDGKRFCVRGFGASALPLDTLLYTETGVTTIGECSVGDKIYGADGKLCTIEVKSEIFNRPVYRINLIDGRNITVCEEHINNVVFRKSGRNACRFVEENIQTKDLLKRKIYSTRSNRDTKEHIAYIKNIQAIEYPKKQVPLDPYLVGLLLGDGSMKQDGSNILHCHKDDLQTYLDNIPYEIGAQDLDKRNSTVVSFSILNIYKEVEELGLRDIAMSDKFIPECYFQSSIEQRTDMLAGLLDTDGCITKNGRIEFVNTSEQLVKDVARLVVTLGGSAVTRNAYIDGKHNSGGYNRVDAYKCEIWITNDNIVKLERKKSRLVENKIRQRWIKRSNMVAIESIEEVPMVSTQCIGVDSQDHLFIAGTDMVVTHNTGVRGFKEYGKRPNWLGLDDLMSDKNAESPTIQRDIKHIIYKAARQAMHPKKRMTIWTGTPFNKSDPLYEATSSRSWNTRVYPICEKYPCEKKDFRGAWEDRFDYDFVKSEYDSLLEDGEIASFNQELMLRITSDEDRLVQENEITWYQRDRVIQNSGRYNFYITTDFATSDKAKSDFSVISVWAYTNNKDWLLVDGICKRQLMDQNVKDLFKYVSIYKPLSVGIEINGQQQGFISWLKGEMITKNTFFNLAGKGTVEGIRRNGSKIENFKLFVPTIKARKLWLPEEMKTHPLVEELIEELRFATGEGFKSKHDDVADTLSMLLDMDPYAPSQDAEPEYVENEDGNFAFFNDDDEDLYKNSTIF